MTPPRKVHITFRLFAPCVELLKNEGLALDIYEGVIPEPREQLFARAKDCEGLVCGLFDDINREFLGRAPALRFIAQFGVGYNNIDVAAAAERGIRVSNTPGVLTDATAEMAWALLLAAARRVGEGERLVRAGKWPGWEPDQMLGAGVTGATLGIVGAGRIGAAMAAMGRGFRMKTLYTSRKPNDALERELGARRVGLDALLRESDFVSIHVALNDATRHLIGARELALMKPSAVLVNTARGAVVHEAALLAALRERRIAAAGLDVYENEPALEPGLAELENVVLAPHLGSATLATRTKMGMLAAENMRAMMKGDAPLNPVV